MITEEGDRLRITGAVNMDTVASMKRKIEAFARRPGRWILDLSAAAPLDSAALALVLSAIRAARLRGQRMTLEGGSAQFYALVALYELGDLLTPSCSIVGGIPVPPLRSTK